MREWDGTPLVYSRHAIRRLGERGILKSEVLAVISYGQIIETYSSPNENPGCLMLCFVESKPFHVVLCYNVDMKVRIVVTVYVPDPEEWQDGFQKRRNA